ncbi:hypothetical protein ACFQY0_20945 [Haloferula chungangensis]|uniref:Uncharacterized protein n=1 Tax=Haloferula chungangensis TaxID=1048331 RepID=A0ABW2LDM7_9BACT
MGDRLIITHIPSLVATLLNKERAKGAPLTRKEVESIRDEAPAQVLTPEQRAAIDERREYDDIVPERAWEDWQVARLELIADE